MTHIQQSTQNSEIGEIARFLLSLLLLSLNSPSYGQPSELTDDETSFEISAQVSTEAEEILNVQAPDDDLPVLDLDTPIRMNFSGNWEKDFARSDNWEDELNRRMNLRQQNAAAQRAGIGLGGGPSVTLGNTNLNSPRRREANLFVLARLSEYINRSSTMEIFQDRERVRIERRGEAPLICGMDT
ncbi:MAG: hypothetical protein P8N11_12715, partial [Gammaproteobacteria bacterium]|nr:hypothetical protein [Gammaproteobacteria bacterium]